MPTVTVNTIMLRGLEPVRVRIVVDARQIPTIEPGTVTFTFTKYEPGRDARVRIASAAARLDLRLHETPYSYAVHAYDRNGRDIAHQASFDLAVALAIFELNGRTVTDPRLNYVGELTLDGELRPVRGAYARARAGRCVMPIANVAEISPLFQHGEVFFVQSLSNALVGMIVGVVSNESTVAPTGEDLAAGLDPEVVAKIDAKIRLGLDLMIVGPKSRRLLDLARYAAKRICRSPLTKGELLNLNVIHGAAGILHEKPLTERPIRAPHNSVSETGLVGGGDVPRPGEITLAHGGALILDDVDEFRATSREALARAVRDAKVTFRQDGVAFHYPAVPLGIVATARLETELLESRGTRAALDRQWDVLREIAKSLNLTIVEV